MVWDRRVAPTNREIRTVFPYWVDEPGILLEMITMVVAGLIVTISAGVLHGGRA